MKDFAKNWKYISIGLMSLLFTALFPGSPLITAHLAAAVEHESDPGLPPKAAVPAEKIPNQYIVVLRDDVADPSAVAKDIAKKHGLALGHIYKQLKGFSATIPAPVLEKVKSDSRVSYVEQDQLVQISLHTNNFETLTTGINRIDADLNSLTDTSTVNIAIIDTGVWLTHTDLNAKAGKNCLAPSNSPNDDNGHGTHVAGVAAAKTNDNKGVRGVSPNAVVYAVKVLDRTGSGPISSVICGVDWVTANALIIDVANMSLGCACHSEALHDAVKKSVAAGVTYTVSAGNDAKDIKDYDPASYPEVITVSAMGDSDGKCGAQGPSPDDTFATFSNFGSGIDLAAPGVDIVSTWKGDSSNPGGLYATASGTSMAAPHVAGAAALYIAANPSASPSQIQNALLGSSIPQTQSCNLGSNNGAGGFMNGISPEPLAYVASFAPPNPDFSLSASPSTLTIQAGNSGASTITVASLNAFSGTVSLTVGAPAGLTASLNPTSVSVSSGGSDSSTLTTQVSSDTAAGSYVVSVTGTSGSLVHSTSITVIVQTVPTFPQNLAATAGNAQVTLSWSAPLDNGGSTITNYKIYRGTLSGQATLLTTIGNVLAYSDTAVINGQNYFYQVTAVNAVGESPRSNEAGATPNVSFPIIHMSDTTKSSGTKIANGDKTIVGEHVTGTSQLVGDKIDQITLRLKKVGAPTGNAIIGIFDSAGNLKKQFGTKAVNTLTTSFADYTSSLAGGELYTIVSGDSIGIKYTGGDPTANYISITRDTKSADPFDGTSTHYQQFKSGVWSGNNTHDVYMILKQTHG